MLHQNEYGYAVMTKELDAYSLQDISLETCKRYCHKGYVVVRMIPKVCGFSITIRSHEFYEIFNFKRYPKNILWLHWYVNKEYFHKIGEIVYENT